MTLLRVDGSQTGMRISSDYFVDTFERGAPDVVEPLGNGWVDLATVEPASYDQMGILNGAVVTRALTRSAAAGKAYCPNPGSDYDDFLNHPEDVIPGICGAWQTDIGTPDVYVEVLWSGRWTLPDHTEATPAVCVVPGTGETGFGAWIGEFAGIPALGAGCVGDPPEDFSTYVEDGAFLPDMDTGVTHRVGVLSSNGGTEARVFLDRRQVRMITAGLDPLPIPVALQGSTLHGMFSDQHMCYPPGEPVSLAFMQTVPSIFEVRIFTR